MLKCMVVLLAALPLVSTSKTIAAIYCLPPTPYSSIQDSPFNVSGLNPPFFLEDMENGISQPSSTTVSGPTGIVLRNASLRLPGAFTDSVDADDGAVDGLGNGGHSLVPVNYTTYPTFPYSYQSVVEIAWTSPAPSLINSFGFVWTDGLERLELGMGVPGEVGCHYETLLDGLNTGETAEDRFVGFISDDVFQNVQFSIRSQGFGPPEERFEFDHIQFGFQIVPEPLVGLFWIPWLVVYQFIRRIATPLAVT